MGGMVVVTQGRNKGKCYPETTGRVKDNAMLLISMQPFKEVVTRRVLKEQGKEAWILWARKGLWDSMKVNLKTEQLYEG